MVYVGHLCRFVWGGGKVFLCMNEFCFLSKKLLPLVSLSFLVYVYGLRYP